MSSVNVISVSDLTKQVKLQLEQPIFKQIAVEGEISNFKHHSSGHMYFTLKDEKSRIKAVMFRGRNQWLDFQPRNGETIIALGSLGVYEANGEYQIYVERIFPQGMGALHIQFEQLKESLEKEGLFAAERKRPLPFLPRHIAVVTSPTSAAIRDILSVIKRRYPSMSILVIPAVVQGDAGPASIVKSLAMVATQDYIDLVIVARGGGSIEELWAFNDEQVARAIYQCPVPVISGVGHETDYTIADFVADHRAPTPSAAAELAVPDYRALHHDVDRLRLRLDHGLVKLVNNKRKQVFYLTNRGVFNRPLDRINKERQRTDELLSRVGLNVYHRRVSFSQRLQMYVGKLDSLSPLATLTRGYAVCQKMDGSVITNSRQMKLGERVIVRLSCGKLQCAVEKGDHIDDY